MKIIHKLSYVLMAALVFTACKTNGPDGPAPEPPSKLVLSADKESIMGDGREKATFTVKYGDVDVTTDATIFAGDTELKDKTFASTDGGEYIFTATYTDKETEELIKSNEIKVTVTTLMLSVEPEELSVGTGEKAVFKVTYMDQDVTANAVITNLTNGEDMEKGANEFAVPSYTGEFQFKAKYINLVSNTITVKVGAPVVNDLRLVADKGRVSVGEEVNFTVLDKGNAVTNNAKIKNVTTGEYLDGGNFKATSGTTEFVAEYEGKSSPSVYVSTGRFHKNVLTYKFTNINCGYCTMMATALEKAKSLFPDRIVEVDIHHPLMGTDDPMIPSNIGDFDGYFPQVWKGIPYTTFDLTQYFQAAVSTSEVLGKVKPLAQKIADAGISASSSVSGSTVTVDVNVTAVTPNTYYLGVMLLENGIVYRQNSGSNNYVHNHVLRETASSSIFGDSLESMTENQQVSKQYTIQLKNNYVANNCTIVCFVLYKDGENWIAANAIELPVQGWVDYRFE